MSNHIDNAGENAEVIKKKAVPVKEKKKSSYLPQFFSGDNQEAATLIADYHTLVHSDKIKAGNNLEKDIADDIDKHSEYNLHMSKKINDPGVKAPCVIIGCKFEKKHYEDHNLECKNKKAVEVDLCIINADNEVFIVELKNGCDFDTKKSKGEVQSLETTKTLCEKMGFNRVECCICCYDAIKKSDMKLKTTMGQVNTILYSELAEKCGLNGEESRQRINRKVELRAYDNLQKLDDFVTTYMAMKNKSNNL